MTGLSIYAPDIRAPQYVRKMILKKEELAVAQQQWENLAPQLYKWTDHPDRKTNKETQALNDALCQMNLIDIYGAFYPKAAEYTFLRSAHRLFSRIDHMMGHKVSLCKFKKIEILSSIFSSHNGMRLEINYKK